MNFPTKRLSLHFFWFHVETVSEWLFVAAAPLKLNKPGTAQVGAISKAQKDSKTTFSTTGDNKSSQQTKN